MKNLLVIVAALFIVINVKAQQPSPDPDTLNNTIKQIDPVMRQYPDDAYMIDKMKRIAADDLPEVVQDSLRVLEPADWQKSVVYKNNEQNIYYVEVRGGKGDKRYYFDERGKRIYKQSRSEDGYDNDSDDQ